MRWWGGRAVDLEEAVLSAVWDWDGRGPALPLRELGSAGWLPLGVPGPREDWRREEEVAGMERWVAFRRRRLEVSVEGERALEREADGAARVEFTVMGAVVVRGEGWRVGCWTRRLRGLLAIVVEGPALPERGCNGVDVLDMDVVRGGRRELRVLLLLLLSREGSCGSMAMAPSFWRSRILRSRRLICRSSTRDILSARLIFSSWKVWALS